MATPVSQEVFTHLPLLVGNPARDHHDAVSTMLVFTSALAKSTCPDAVSAIWWENLLPYSVCLGIMFFFSRERRWGIFLSKNFVKVSMFNNIFYILLTSFCVAPSLQLHEILFLLLWDFCRESFGGNFLSPSPASICGTTNFCFREMEVGSMLLAFCIFTVFLRPLKLLPAHG